MFTSSFAWTPSPASAAMTSFAFMFDEVPEPVWKTSIGNWSSSSPFAMRSAGCRDPLGLLGVEEPEIGVHARGRGLDAPEPASDMLGDRLAGDLEVLYGFRRLTTPKLAPRAESISALFRHRPVRPSPVGSQWGGGWVRLGK